MLPFHSGAMFGALAGRHGTVLADEAGLRLAFRDEAQPAAAAEDGVEALAIPWSRVLSLAARHGLAESRLVVRLSSGTGTAGLPLSGEGDLTLRVQRKNREVLDDFLAGAERFRAGRTRGADVDTTLDDVRKFIDRI
jgi:hypothetical protein